MSTEGEGAHKSKDCFNPPVNHFTRKNSKEKREGLAWRKLQQNMQKDVKGILIIVSENVNWFVVISLF